VAKRRDGNRDDYSARHHKPSLGEWTAAGLGVAITLAAIGFMVYEAVSAAPDAIPAITVRVERVVVHPSGYVVEFRATNDGDATAAQVLVQGELRGDAGTVERSEATIDFVPARSWRRGGLVFGQDPRGGRVEVRVLGFDRP
jgi:uncharacterized protein (TIGR02588 family)